MDKIGVIISLIIIVVVAQAEKPLSLYLPSLFSTTSKYDNKFRNFHIPDPVENARFYMCMSKHIILCEEKREKHIHRSQSAFERCLREAEKECTKLLVDSRT